ncbi:MAG: ribonuclease HII [Pseudomonadota bacterium]|nr:ribonuclease HII [Pseudomonadota bacterium]|tara:strand:- start:16472 stop:17032 length:561 start_codon:yes stop_codon:yes gene_type:complete
MILAGVDEAGRGSLAGPVVAAAVIINDSIKIEGIRDSKDLSKNQRSALEEKIKQLSTCWSIAWASVEEIDTINILQASLLAMKRAVEGLEVMPTKVFCDGPYLPELPMKGEAIIGGDKKIESIMSASILAKVERDRIMSKLNKDFPLYFFDKHKGYPTKSHKEALRLYGPCKLHRRSFKPVQQSLR